MELHGLSNIVRITDCFPTPDTNNGSSEGLWAGMLHQLGQDCSDGIPISPKELRQGVSSVL